MPNVSSFGAQTDNSVVQGTVTDRAMIIPDVPPQGLMSVGPRVTPHFVKPSLWSALTTYHFFDAVHDAAGASYVAIKPEVPAGTELTDEGYWFLWADPNSQFADLSELVKTFNGRITQNTADIATKAPNNHASKNTTYGVGNALNYGHVRLATNETPTDSGDNSGIAATPSYVAKQIEGTKKKVVLIGDSFSEQRYLPDGKLWIDTVAERMNFTVYNFAEGGSGFIASGDRKGTFASNLNKAISDTRFNNNDVDYLLVMGGTNDIKEQTNFTSYAAMRNAIKNLFNTATSNFKNAAVMYVGSSVFETFKNKSMSDTSIISEYGIQQMCNEIVPTMSLTFFWPGQHAFFTNGYADHPNQAGHDAFANAVIASFNGAGNAFKHVMKLTPTLKDDSVYKLAATGAGLNNVVVTATPTQVTMDYQTNLTTETSYTSNAELAYPLNLVELYEGASATLTKVATTRVKDPNLKNGLPVMYQTTNSSLKILVNILGSTESKTMDLYISVKI